MGMTHDSLVRLFSSVVALHAAAPEGPRVLDDTPLPPSLTVPLCCSCSAAARGQPPGLDLPVFLPVSRCHPLVPHIVDVQN